MNQAPHTGTKQVNCRVNEQCGACQLLETPYEQQLSEKQDEVIRLFSSFVDDTAKFMPIVGMERPYHYRNKVVSPFVPGRKVASAKQTLPSKTAGKKKQKAQPPRARYEILTGMYAQGSHRIISTDTCLIENETAKKIIQVIRDLMPAFRYEPYREDAGTGFIRHAMIRVGHTSGEVLVTLVTNAKEFPRSKDFSRELVKRCPSITSIVQNVNTRQTNVILGEEEHTLYGPGFILDKLCGLSFRISSQSFYQVNAVQTEVLYQKSIEMAALTGCETVIDAYCGTGTIGLVAARGIGESKGAAKVIGVDATASSIRDARLNAKHNGIKNAEFRAADAGSFMRELAESRAQAVDVVFMDPPRAGASTDFLDALATLGPSRIVYISCNPQTQVRDVAHLIKKGYRVDRIQAVDLFPHTTQLVVRV